jgi:hypothetical protein
MLSSLLKRISDQVEPLDACAGSRRAWPGYSIIFGGGLAIEVAGGPGEPLSDSSDSKSAVAQFDRSGVRGRCGSLASIS